MVSQSMLACLGGSAWNRHRAKSTPTSEGLLINHRNCWLDGGYYFPSLESAICPIVGLFANGIRSTIRTSELGSEFDRRRIE
jgi:hypothetical protein